MNTRPVISPATPGTMPPGHGPLVPHGAGHDADLAVLNLLSGLNTMTAADARATAWPILQAMFSPILARGITHDFSFRPFSEVATLQSCVTSVLLRHDDPASAYGSAHIQHYKARGLAFASLTVRVAFPDGEPQTDMVVKIGVLRHRGSSIDAEPFLVVDAFFVCGEITTDTVPVSNHVVDGFDALRTVPAPHGFIVVGVTSASATAAATVRVVIPGEDSCTYIKMCPCQCDELDMVVDAETSVIPHDAIPDDDAALVEQIVMAHDADSHDDEHHLAPLAPLTPLTPLSSASTASLPSPQSGISAGSITAIGDTPTTPIRNAIAAARARVPTSPVTPTPAPRPRVAKFKTGKPKN